MRDVAIVLGIIGLIVVWRKPGWVWWWTALASVALEVIHHWYGGVGQYMPVVGGVIGAMIAYFPRRALWSFLWERRSQYWGFLVYTVIVWISVVVSIDRHVSLRYAIGVPAIFWLTAGVMPYLIQETKMTLADVLKPMVWAGTLSALAALIGAVFFHQGFVVPVGHHHLLAWEWPYANKNTLGMLMVFSTPAALGLYLARDHVSRGRNWYGLAFLLNFIAMVFSYARDSWIATSVGLLVIVIVRYRKCGVLGVLITGIVVLLAAVLATGVKRWERLWQHGLTGRTGLWKAAYIVFKQHPIFGVGAGNSPEAIRPYVPPAYRGLSPHDSILRTLVELGLVGLITWIIMMLVALYRYFFASSQTEGWMAVVLGAVLVAALVEQAAESIFFGGVFFGDLFFTALVSVGWLLPTISRPSYYHKR